MTTKFRTALVAFLFPLLVSLLAGGSMMQLTGRSAFSETDAPESKPLNLRPAGYSPEDVRAYWEFLGQDALAAEVRFLKADLAYPFAYGAALLFAFFLIRRPLSPVLLVVGASSVVATMVADWCENAIHLREVAHFIADQPLDSAWLHTASSATTVKWLSLLVAMLVLLAAIAQFLRREGNG